MIFEAVRAIPAHEAAQRLGIPLRRNGSRFWACCPIHGEKTASVCFYPDGRWYCFGCHAGGSTVDLYLQVLGLSSSREAAQRAAADFGLVCDDTPSPRRSVWQLRRALEARKRETIHGLRRVVAAADEVLVCFKDESAWDSREFVAALSVRSWASDRLAQLESTILTTWQRSCWR